MSQIRLIVGLGNIGNEYLGTRHNAGEWFVETIADKFNTPMNLNNKFHGKVATINHYSHKLYLLYPNTFMNKSGLAVGAIANFYKIAAHEILVAHDELDLPAGDIRLKQSGGHGGHNGLRDIERALGSRDFFRMRIGIDHPGDRNKVISYVLGKPPIEDKIEIDHAIDRAISYLDDIILFKHQGVMNQLHRKKT